MPTTVTELLESIIQNYLASPPWDVYSRYQRARRIIRGEKGKNKEEDARVERLETAFKDLLNRYGGITLYDLQLIAYFTNDLTAYFYLPNGNEVTVSELRADMAAFVVEMDDAVWEAMPRLG